jgi:hypothetical protein
MLQAMLVFSVAFTFWCIYAESHPPKVKVDLKPTPTMVEMAEDNDFDDDPPTVVDTGRKAPHDVVVNHKIELNWWSFISPSLRPVLMRWSQFLTWLSTL